jgi:hypothetical protein
MMRKNDPLARVLDDLARRADARHADRLAAQRRVGLRLPIAEVLDLRGEFGLVSGEARRRRGGGTGRATATRPARQDADRSVGQPPRLHELNAAEPIPGAVQIGTAAGQPRRRLRGERLEPLGRHARRLRGGVRRPRSGRGDGGERDPAE